MEQFPEDISFSLFRARGLRWVEVNSWDGMSAMAEPGVMESIEFSNLEQGWYRFLVEDKQENGLCCEEGSGFVSLTGPVDGVMAGLLVYGDRNAPTIMQHFIRSTNAHTLTGTIYLPRGDLRVDPGSQVGQNSAYTAIVANKIDIDQGPELVLNSDYDATDVPAPSGIKTSAQVVLSD